MNTRTYYELCIAQQETLNNNFTKKPLLGVIDKGSLTKETLNEFKAEWLKQIDTLKPFVPNLSEIATVGEQTNFKTVLEKVCEEIMPLVDNVFGCYSRIDGMKILRHLKSEDADAQAGAFMWHTDQHPKEIINVMLYINDVSKIEHGPFQYLVNKNGDAYYNKGFSKTITDAKANEVGAVETVLGDSGDFFIFDNNFYHRASVPTEKDRDVIIFQVRPSRKKQEKYLNLSYINMPFRQKISAWDKNE
jgi:hypothetical protein